MVKVKVLLGFAELSVPLEVDFAKNTHTKMKNNATFPTPDVPLVDIKNAAEDLENKYNAAQGGGTQATAEMDAAKIVLTNLLRKQAAYVNRIADGDSVKILSSGFLPSKGVKEPIPAPAKPENLKLKSGTPGMVSKTIEKVENAKAFATILLTNPNSPVAVDGNNIIITSGADKIIIHIGTDRNCAFTNLASGSRVYVTTVAYNSAGASPSSDSVNVVVG